MSRRLEIVALAASLIAFAALGPGASSAHSRTRCAVRGSHTIKGTRTTRIYSRVVYIKQLHSRGAVLYGCLYRLGRSYRLPGQLDNCPNDFEPDLPLLRAAGPFVGYPAEGCTTSADLAFVFVVDLRSGKRLRATHGTWQQERPRSTAGFSSASRTRAFVMRPDGSIAWIVEREADPAYGTPLNYEVRKSDGSEAGCRLKATWCPPDSPGNFRLDQSPQIDPTSLLLAGSTLSWRNNGVTKTAELR